MPSALSLCAAGAAVAVAAYALNPSKADPTGHLIVQIEGDVDGLRITRITPKVDPWGPARIAETPYQILVRSADGTVLGRYPLDLSQFDLDPARAGRGLAVEGCVVRDARIATLTSVPHFPDADRLEVVRGSDVIGSLDSPALRAMVEEGRRRR